MQLRERKYRVGVVQAGTDILRWHWAREAGRDGNYPIVTIKGVGAYRLTSKPVGVRPMGRLLRRPGWIVSEGNAESSTDFHGGNGSVPMDSRVLERIMKERTIRDGLAATESFSWKELLMLLTIAAAAFAAVSVVMVGQDVSEIKDIVQVMARETAQQGLALEDITRGGVVQP